jgi:hypothetical protein
MGETGGWQVNVEYFEDYVIKNPKTSEEISEKIYGYLKSKNRLSELDPIIRKMQEGLEKSIKLIKNSKIPRSFFANAEFLKDGKIKQKKVLMLEEKFKELISKNKMDDSKKLIDRVIDFLIFLWKYQLHEKTFKFYTQIGIVNDELVLVDFGEITGNKETVKKQILKKNKKLEQFREYYHDEVLDYFQEQVSKRLTINVLDKNWGKNIG